MGSIFQIPDEDNLVTYYMLPLVGANKLTFGRHFKSSYIDALGHKLFVELKSNMIAPIYKSNPNYITEVLIGSTIFIQFVFPTVFLNDTALFIQGTYSRMSNTAKKVIYTTSTLPYNATKGSFTVSHPVLQALDKTQTLRTFLMNTLGVELLDNEELMESPHASWFIEHRIKLKT